MKTKPPTLKNFVDVRMGVDGDDYELPFRFIGKLHKLTIESGGRS